MISGKAPVNVEYQSGFRARLRLGFVDGMAFLPEKLRRAQKQARPHFPADHVCPLIDQAWQIAGGLNTSRITGTENRLRSGPDHKRLRQRARWFHFSISIHLQARVCDDRAFLGEALDVFRLLREITQRNKKREVSIAMASRAKHAVALTLHVFPNSVTPRTNHHATPYVRWLGQFRGAYNLMITFRKVLAPSRSDRW